MGVLQYNQNNEGNIQPKEILIPVNEHANILINLFVFITNMSFNPLILYQLVPTLKIVS